jgi:divalent metal cation (Fe/Co/Zn/Cd) transporter
MINLSLGMAKAESFSAVFQVCLIILGAFHLFEAIIDRVSNPRALSTR